MNDWSRLAVDPKTTQKLGTEKTNCTNTNTLSIRLTGRAYQESSGFTKGFVERSGEDNSVCP